MSDTGDEAKAPDRPMRRETDNSVIMSIPVSIDVVLGTTEMPVHQLMALKRGTTVTLDRRIGEPVDVVVSGRRIARGEIVVLEDDPTRFGIKLTEVVET
ncbi:MAG: flagellar motor switch protein FliN [Rhizobiaceae bacterium]